MRMADFKSAGQVVLAIAIGVFLSSFTANLSIPVFSILLITIFSAIIFYANRQ